MFLLSHCVMREAASERIKRPAWKGKELAQRQSKADDTSLSHFLWMLQNKNRLVWFAGFELSFPLRYSCLRAPVKKWLLVAHLPVFTSLTLLIQPIDWNQNNLNLKERACEFNTPITVFFNLSSRPPSSSLLLLICHSQWGWWNNSCPQHSSHMHKFTQQQPQAAHTGISSQLYTSWSTQSVIHPTSV